MDNGQWTMIGQWTVDNRRRNGQWTIGGAMDNGQWTMDNGRSMDSGQSAAQWTADNGQSGVD